MRKRIYVGVKTERGKGTTYERFLHPETPTEVSHGEKYNAVVGPFRTKAGALFMIHFGHGNPHCRDVNEAERLAKIHADSLKGLGDRKTA